MPISNREDADLAVVRQLLKPIVKICLRRGVLFRQVMNLLKTVFIEVGEEQLSQITSKINVSRLSVMTGVHRLDTDAIFRNRNLPKADEPITIVSRVISLWSQKKEYLTTSGKPKVLTYKGPDSDFFKLVGSITNTVNPATVLFELDRNGAIKKTPNGLKLTRQTRTLTAHEEKAYEFLGRDIEYLVRALEENLEGSEKKMGNLHHRTDYDNIYLKHLPKIRKWLLQKGRKFHKDARNFVAKFDKDLSPTVDTDEPAGGKVHFSTFSLMEPPE